MGRTDTSDTSALLAALDDAQDPQLVLAALRGPWAVVYFEASSKRLWFGNLFLLSLCAST